jgi:integrase/recombinase XerC
MQPSANLVDAYLAHIRTGKRLAERTVDVYSQELNKLSALCQSANITLLDVTHTHIRRWTATAHSAGKAGKTLALQLSSWRSFYKWLILQGHMAHNPCLDIKPPKISKPLPKALGVDAAMAMAEYRGASHLQTSLIIELLYGCGLRVSELVGLDITASQDAIDNARGWIDADALEVHVFGKGSKRRMVPLGTKAAEALALYLKVRSAAPSEAALLLSPKGVRLTRQAVWALLKEQSLNAGLAQSVHPHMLRHSFASHVLQSSGDLRAVQELLGHSSIASTQVYTRLDFQHLAKIYDNAHPRAKLKTTPLSATADISPTSQGQTLKDSS